MHLDCMKSRFLYILFELYGLVTDEFPWLFLFNPLDIYIFRLIHWMKSISSVSNEFLIIDTMERNR